MKFILAFFFLLLSTVALASVNTVIGTGDVYVQATPLAHVGAFVDNTSVNLPDGVATTLATTAAGTFSNKKIRVTASVSGFCVTNAGMTTEIKLVILRNGVTQIAQAYVTSHSNTGGKEHSFSVSINRSDMPLVGNHFYVIKATATNTPNAFYQSASITADELQ